MIPEVVRKKVAVIAVVIAVEIVTAVVGRGVMMMMNMKIRALQHQQAEGMYNGNNTQGIH